MSYEKFDYSKVQSGSRMGLYYAGFEKAKIEGENIKNAIYIFDDEGNSFKSHIEFADGTAVIQKSGNGYGITKVRDTDGKWHLRNYDENLLSWNSEEISNYHKDYCENRSKYRKEGKVYKFPKYGVDISAKDFVIYNEERVPSLYSLGWEDGGVGLRRDSYYKEPNLFQQELECPGLTKAEAKMVKPKMVEELSAIVTKKLESLKKQLSNMEQILNTI